MILYSTDLKKKYWESGNYDRDQSSVVFKAVDYDRVVLVTGWNKEGPPNENLRWRQSRGRRLRTDRIGFEDGEREDDDYADAVVTIRLED